MLALRDDLLPAVAAGAVVYLGVVVLFERLVYPEDAQTIRTFLRRRS
jgi:hypothetical protein